MLEGGVLASGAPNGRAPANAESWFLSEAFDQLAEHGVKGIVAFSDPVARVVEERTIWPGHHGIIYQASNAAYTGRGTPRSLIVLPDGTSLVDRALQKVRRQEQGHEYVERQLYDLGARPRRGEHPATWLKQALDEVHAVRLRHQGCHRYLMWTTKPERRTGRRRTVSLPYPKPNIPPTARARTVPLPVSAAREPAGPSAVPVPAYTNPTPRKNDPMPLSYVLRTPLDVPAPAFNDNAIAVIEIRGSRYGGDWVITANAASAPEPLGKIETSYDMTRRDMTQDERYPDLAVDTAYVWLHDHVTKHGWRLLSWDNHNKRIPADEKPYFMAAQALIGSEDFVPAPGVKYADEDPQ